MDVLLEMLLELIAAVLLPQTWKGLLAAMVVLAVIALSVVAIGLAWAQLGPR